LKQLIMMVAFRTAFVGAGVLLASVQAMTVE